MTQKTTSWTIKNISKDIKDSVTSLAKEEGISVGEFVEQALKNAQKKYNAVLDTSKLKTVKDVRPILNRLEQRLIKLESADWMNIH